MCNSQPFFTFHPSVECLLNHCPQYLGLTIPFLFIAGKLRQLPFFNFAQETDRCQCYMKNKATGMSSYLQVIF